MSQIHHQGDPSESSQLAGLIAMILLFVFTAGMFLASVAYSNNAAQGTAGRPVPTMVRPSRGLAPRPGRQADGARPRR